MNGNTTTLLEDENSDLVDDPLYAGMPGLEPRDADSSDDDLDNSMPVLLTRSNNGWDSSDDESDDDCDDEEYDLSKSNFTDIEMIGNLTSKARKPKSAFKADTKTGMSKPARLIYNISSSFWGHDKICRQFQFQIVNTMIMHDQIFCDETHYYFLLSTNLHNLK